LSSCVVVAHGQLLLVVRSHVLGDNHVSLAEDVLAEISTFLAEIITVVTVITV